MTRPIVLVAEPLAPSAIEVLGADFDVRECDGADRAELLRAVADADAVIVRSATRVDAEVLAAAHPIEETGRELRGMMSWVDRPITETA